MTYDLVTLLNIDLQRSFVYGSEIYCSFCRFEPREIYDCNGITCQLQDQTNQHETYRLLSHHEACLDMLICTTG
jgi:hypothetical protein